MAQLPQELIVEILLWLPVESLLRFRCLSKSSCAVIDSPNFTNWHLSKSSQKFNLRKIIFPDRSRVKFNVCDVNVDLEEDILPLGQQVSIFWRDGDVCGTCNGLLLLYLTERYPFGFVIWNPSTCQFRDLPDCPCEVLANVDSFISNGSGLGYDHSTDDYKAIITMYVKGKGGDIEVEVQVWIFSLKTNIWRRAQNFPYYPDAGLNSGIGCFTDGSLHWICTFINGNQSVDDDRRKEIVAFDVRKETFSLLPQPVICSINSLDCLSPKLHVLDSCLCISYFYSCEPARVDLFIRKKDGADSDKFSWTKIFSVTEPLSFNIRFLRFMKVLRYSKRGDKILIHLGRPTLMVSYDIKEKSFRNVEIDMDLSWKSPIVCLESLVSVGGGA